MFQGARIDDEAASLALALKLQAEFDGEETGTTGAGRWPYRGHRKSEQSRHANYYPRRGLFSFRPSRDSRFRDGTNSSPGPIDVLPAVETGAPMTDEELAKLLQQQEDSESAPGNTSSGGNSRPTSSSSSIRRRPVPPPPVPARFLPDSPPITPIRPQNPPTSSAVDDDLPPPYTPRGSAPPIPQPPVILSPPYTPGGRDEPLAGVEQRFSDLSLGGDSESAEVALLAEDRSITANDEIVARLLQEEYLRGESRLPIDNDDEFIEQLQLQYSRSKS